MCTHTNTHSMPHKTVQNKKAEWQTHTKQDKSFMQTLNLCVRERAMLRYLAAAEENTLWEHCHLLRAQGAKTRTNSVFQLWCSCALYLSLTQTDSSCRICLRKGATVHPYLSLSLSISFSTFIPLLLSFFTVLLKLCLQRSGVLSILLSSGILSLLSLSHPH